MDLVLSLPLTADDVARFTLKAGGQPLEAWLADHIWVTMVLPLRHQQRRQAQRVVVNKLTSLSDEALTEASEAIDAIKSEDRVGVVR